MVKYACTFKNLLKTKKQKLKVKIRVSVPKGMKFKDYKSETEEILKILEQSITQYSTESIE
ncbi:MAG: hypothetical protein ACXADU_04545 [Promethearchaeota archaeon]|jgi:hypothetical protein